MTEKVPHVLYVAWGFPPARTGGVYRALATANALAERGFRVTVMTTDELCWEKYTGADPSLLAQVDSRINLLRVPFEWPVLNPNLSDYSWLRVRFPRVWNRLRQRLDRRVFPENSYGPWRTSIEQAAVELHAHDPVDVVLSTANPNVAFTPAVLLHEKFNVPYFVDHRDAWSLDVFDGRQLFDKNSVAGKWEQRIFAGASQIWFVNEPIAIWHRQHYPEFAEKITVVSNGWDPNFLDQTLVTARKSQSSTPFTFGYLGTVSSKVPIAEFVAGWSLAHQQNELISHAVADIRGYLGFYGTANAKFATVLSSAEDHGVIYSGPVQKGEVSQLYQNWDACLLILGAGKYVTSGKVFEYMATGKPIISIHDPQNAASDVLSGYPLWFPVQNLQPSEIEKVLVEVINQCQSISDEVRQECLNYAHQFRRDVVLANAVDAIANRVGLK